MAMELFEEVTEGCASCFGHVKDNDTRLMMHRSSFGGHCTGQPPADPRQRHSLGATARPTGTSTRSGADYDEEHSQLSSEPSNGP
jgi:hypothetical protein